MNYVCQIEPACTVFLNSIHNTTNNAQLETRAASAVVCKSAMSKTEEMAVAVAVAAAAARPSKTPGTMVGEYMFPPNVDERVLRAMYDKVQVVKESYYNVQRAENPDGSFRVTGKVRNVLATKPAFKRLRTTAYMMGAEDQIAHPKSCGKAMPHMATRIVDEEGKPLPHDGEAEESESD